MDILKTPIPQSVLDSVDNYIANKTANLLPKFNPTNTASGVDSITLNKESGVLSYSKTVSSGEAGYFSLFNNLIKPNSVIMWNIVYSGVGGEQLIPLSYYNNLDGSIVFFVGIYNGEVSANSTVINFQIVG